MKGAVKANTVDKYLKPIRHQIIDLVEPDSTVIELGCGNGDLLLKLSHKIKHGLGIDISASLIQYAIEKSKKEGQNNLKFICAEATINSESAQTYNYAVASLLLHVMPQHQAVKLLKHMMEIADMLIICEFSKPENWKQRFLLWLDQRFSGHYHHFKAFQNNNYMAGLLQTLSQTEYVCYDTFDPVIKIYTLMKKK